MQAIIPLDYIVTGYKRNGFAIFCQAKSIRTITKGASFTNVKNTWHFGQWKDKCHDAGGDEDDDDDDVKDMSCVDEVSNKDEVVSQSNGRLASGRCWFIANKGLK